jgi:formimidoylglutamate deiminase
MGWQHRITLTCGSRRVSIDQDNRQAMQPISLFFDHALIGNSFLPAVTVTVDEFGLIQQIIPNSRPVANAVRFGGAAIPGLPNLHSHTFQRGMAGKAERRGPAGDTFWSWREVMYRFLGRLSPDDVEAIATMAMVEMLEGGFTSLAEFHYLHHDADGRPYANPAEMAERIMAAADQTGMGITLLPVLYSHGGFGGAAATAGQRRFVNTFDAYLKLRDATGKALQALPGGVLGTAPHSLRAVTPDQLTELVNAIPAGPIHMHIAEQQKEVEDCLAWSGQRPVEWLTNHIQINLRWTLIHATHLTQAETTSLAQSGAVAGLCPITEANLGDGLFEAVRFLAQSGTFGVGSDSNVEIAAPAELRLLEYGQRLRHHGRNMLTRQEGASTGTALYLAALAGGAQALAQPVGALALGQPADIVVLDTNHPALCTLEPEDWLNGYIFNAGSKAIRHVLAAGRHVVQDGRHVLQDKARQRFMQTMRGLQ